MENVPVRVDKTAEANETDLEDAIADVVKHQEEDMENVLERVLPIVDEHYQKNGPVPVDTTAEEIVR